MCRYYFTYPMQLPAFVPGPLTSKLVRPWKSRCDTVLDVCALRCALWTFALPDITVQTAL